MRAGLNELPKGWDQIDPKTGAQVGIDKGFDYTPGAARDTSLRQMVQDKMVKYPDAITTALSRDLTRYVNAAAAPAPMRSYISGRWWQVGWLKMRGPCSMPPPLGSEAP